MHYQAGISVFGTCMLAYLQFRLSSPFWNENFLEVISELRVHENQMCCWNYTYCHINIQGTVRVQLIREIDQVQAATIYVP